MLEIIKKFTPQNFNDLLALMYFPFVAIWVLIVAAIYKYVNADLFTMMGLSTATGVILSKFSDIYQFYFRKSKTEDTKQ